MSEPITVKKYANRRLYNTQTSVYVTLEDLNHMVKRGEDFVVVDAKTGEDLTRSVLGQIIFELENKGEQTLLPIPFLRQLIRFYGDSMQALIPGYLDMALQNFTKEQDNWRGKMNSALTAPFEIYQEQAKQNMKMFEKAFSMFTPFSEKADTPHTIEALKKQMSDLQRQIDEIERTKKV